MKGFDQSNQVVGIQVNQGVSDELKIEIWRLAKHAKIAIKDGRYSDAQAFLDRIVELSNT